MLVGGRDVCHNAWVSVMDFGWYNSLEGWVSRWVVIVLKLWFLDNNNVSLVDGKLK